MLQDNEQLLRQTLDDWRLSRGERRALQAAIEEFGEDDRQLALLRSRACDILRSETTHPETKQPLDWLTDVFKALAPKAAGEASTAVHFP